jgi:hypothetical protein
MRRYKPNMDDKKLQHELKELMRDFDSAVPEGIDIEAILVKANTYSRGSYKRALWWGASVLVICIGAYFIWQPKSDRTVIPIKEKAFADPLKIHDTGRVIIVEKIETKPPSIIIDEKESRRKNNKNKELKTETYKILQKEQEPKSDEMVIRPVTTEEKGQSFRHFIKNKKIEKNQDTLSLFKK